MITKARRTKDFNSMQSSDVVAAAVAPQAPKLWLIKISICN